MKSRIGMKLLIFFVCAILLVACGSGESSQASTAPADSTPAAQESSLAQDTSAAQESDKTTLNLGEFEGETLDGQTLSQEMFADYDLTVVNIWATWCPPCLEEMADLQVVYENLPENVNFVTICDDADEQRDLAITILEENGATFSTLIPSAEIDANIMSRVVAFPTTLFVDSEGNVVGSLAGVPGDNPSDAYLSMIDETLTQL